jgi:2-keto-4-pentenoate hydratase
MEKLLLAPAKAMARHGKAPKPGDVVSLGSFSRLMAPKAGLKVEVECLGLPGSPRVAMGLR